MNSQCPNYKIESSWDDVDKTVDITVTTRSWVTSGRPSATPDETFWGINTETSSIEFTYDGGSTWYSCSGDAL